MSLPVTTLYVIPLIVIWAALWIGVAAGRGEAKVSIGHGENLDLLLKIRRHGNFIEWVPFVLILMALAEIQGGSYMWLNIAGGLLVLGRLAHPFGLRINEVHVLRYVGNTLNLVSVAVLLVMLVRFRFGI